MHKGFHFRWAFVGVFIGFGFIAVGSVAKWPTQSPAPSTSPARDGDDHVPETTDAGLRIECRNDDECIKTSESDWQDGQGPLRRKFLRVRVYNDGPRTAKGCRVTLRGVTEITPNGTLATDYEGPGLLIWSGDRSAGSEGKSIRLNGNPEVADLFYTVLNPAGDEIHLKDERYGSFLKFGRWYTFEVVATAEGLRAVSKNIQVRFGPTWNDFEVFSH
jgi:hypothetical protein